MKDNNLISYVKIIQFQIIHGHLYINRLLVFLAFNEKNEFFKTKNIPGKNITICLHKQEHKNITILNVEAMNLAPSNAIKLEWVHFLYPHHLAFLRPPSFWNFWIL